MCPCVCIYVCACVCGVSITQTYTHIQEEGRGISSYYLLKGTYCHKSPHVVRSYRLDILKVTAKTICNGFLGLIINLYIIFPCILLTLI